MPCYPWSSSCSSRITYQVFTYVTRLSRFSQLPFTVLTHSLCFCDLEVSLHHFTTILILIKQTSSCAMLQRLNEALILITCFCASCMFLITQHDPVLSPLTWLITMCSQCLASPSFFSMESERHMWQESAHIHNHIRPRCTSFRYVRSEYPPIACWFTSIHSYAYNIRIEYGYMNAETMQQTTSANSHRNYLYIQETQQVWCQAVCGLSATIPAK